MFEILNLVKYKDKIYVIKSIIRGNITNKYSLIDLEGKPLAWVTERELSFYKYRNNSISMKALVYIYKMQKLRDKIRKEI